MTNPTDLLPDCFGGPTRHAAGPPSQRFSLASGQMRDPQDRIYKNAVWFNKSGVRVGAGDLSHDDLTRIAQGLTTDEIFIVCPEHFIDDFRARDSRASSTRVNPAAPPRDALTMGAGCLVQPGEIHASLHTGRWNSESHGSMSEVSVVFVNRDELGSLLGARLPSAPSRTMRGPRSAPRQGSTRGF